MELKELQTQLMGAFNELKAAGEKQAAEIKTFGDATQETKATITKINEAIDAFKGRIDAMETSINRLPVNGKGQTSDEEAAAKKAAEVFYKFMREGKSGLAGDERKALVEDSTGQILVPEALDQLIYRELPKLTLMRGLVSTRPIGVDRIRRRSLNELTVGWGKLETSATKKLGDFESSLTPAEAYLYVEDLYGLTKMGEDELEDSDINLQSYLASSFGQAFSEAEDLAILKGTGHANEQPEGILNGTVVSRFNSAAAGAVDADDLIKLYYAVPARYRVRGAYIVQSLIEQNLRLATDTNGQYLWQPSLQAGAPNLFNGRPIYATDVLGDATISTGDEVATYGDYASGYQLLDRTGGSIQRLNELYIEDGLIGFKYKRRVGGGVVRPNAMRVLKVQ